MAIEYSVSDVESDVQVVLVDPRDEDTVVTVGM